MESDRATRSPSVWAVVLGYNHPEDSIECLQSLAASDCPGLRLLYADNGSTEENARKVLEAITSARVIRFDPNIGVGRGFNAAMADALAQGADFLMILNNDTKIHPQAVRRLVEEGIRHPRAAVLVPKIFYYDFPDPIWSAGSRRRAFPPIVVMRKTAGPDDGRFDGDPSLDFACFCAVMFRRDALMELGLLDSDYRFYQEDYDFSLRARRAGWTLRFVPGAHLWHKVSKTGGAGSRNPAVWEVYGRSEALFARKHRAEGSLVGLWHRAYVLLRMIAERKPFGVRPFLRGWREGLRAEMTNPPAWDDPRNDRGLVWRA